MTPQEAIVKFIEDKGVEVPHTFADGVCYVGIKFEDEDEKYILINIVIGHHRIMFNDRHGNKRGLGFEDPRFFDMLENLLETGECPKLSKA